MNEFLEQFLVESRELVDQASDDLLALEKEPRDAQRFEDAFRAFHTLKGGAGIVDFTAMQEAVHAAESAFTTARAESRPLSAGDIDNCLMCLDQVGSWLDTIEASGTLPPDAVAAAVVARFARAASAAPASVASASAAEAGLPQRIREILEAQLQLLATAGGRPAVGSIGSAGIVAENVLRHQGRTAEAELVAAEAAAAVAEAGAHRLVQIIKRVLEGAPAGRPGDAAAVPAAERDAAQAPGPDAARAAEPESARRRDGRAQTLRVNADRIDALVRLTGELTVAKNAIGHAVKLAESEGSALAVTLKNRHASLDRLVGELQRAVVGMRVLPLRVAFQRFPRLIYELAAELGKPATLVIEGEDTEADKAIVEMLVEPLVHVLRNAMDHGVESAARRAATGKPAVATISLRASREGEHVLIEVADDGSGIDVARVRQVAAERSVVTAEELASMNDTQLIDLIFAPGFSTAAAVTQVSGRGVGMGAVRTAVSRLGGHVEVRSAAGKGTTVRFTLPFSVLVTQVMTVEAAGQTFGIPLDAVVETIRVPQDGIFAVGAAHAIVLRNRTIPLVRLRQVLAQRATNGDETGPIVVARIDGDLGALQVDRIGERMEIMLKPLEGLLSGLPGIAGSTLLGDGSVLLVLDLTELLQ